MHEDRWASAADGGARTEARFFAADDLRTFTAGVLEAPGLSPGNAALVARSLVEADLRGVDSHGLVRLGIYVDRLKAGCVNPRPVPRLIRATRSTGVLDGDNGMGQIVGAAAMRLAIEMATGGEPAFVAVRNSNHYGAAAWFAEMACPHDMIGLSLTIGGINHMVPWGGAEAILGNNPFAIAMPLEGEPPFVLDMACSVAARGKIIVAAAEGTPIPEGWAVDEHGRPTTDPQAALRGFVLPMAGPKGYALTMTIGLLSTMLSGAAFGSEVTHQYEDLDHPQNIGHLMGVVPIGAFEERKTYFSRMAKAAAEVRGVRCAPGVQRIFLPGEREALARARHERFGVPLPAPLVDGLGEIGRALGVSLPAPCT